MGAICSPKRLFYLESHGMKSQKITIIDTAVEISQKIRRMPSSGILRRVALVRTDVSEERSGSLITVTRIGELGTSCN
jgi:stage III sporulation protein SpoIIIAA